MAETAPFNSDDEQPILNPSPTDLGFLEGVVLGIDENGELCYMLPSEQEGEITPYIYGIE